MKNLFLNSLAALATLAVSAPLGLAQSNLAVTIPFAFGINSHAVLPAGAYVVTRAGNHWQFRSQENKSAAFVTGIPANSRRSDPARLVFDCRGNHCELRQIQAGYGELGYSIPPPRWSRADSLELAQVVTVPLGRSEGN